MSSGADPLLGKVDALLKKHRGAPESAPESAAQRCPESAQQIAHDSAPDAAPPPGWLPVLTEIVTRGVVPAPAPAPAVPVSSVANTDAAPGQISATDVCRPSAAITDSLAEQLMSELAPRLSEIMEKQVAAELRKILDETVAGLLSQLDVNVREIVRDAVAEKLKSAKPDN